MKPTVAILHDRTSIEIFLRKNPDLYLYHLGDLDDFFFPHTIWYAGLKDSQIEAVVLMYCRSIPPVMLCLCEQITAMNLLIETIQYLLPASFYAHLSPGTEKSLKKYYYLQPCGKHYKMLLTSPETITNMNCSGIEPLSIDNIKAIKWLYEISYPGNWFDEKMLETNQYFGIWKNGELVSIAGVHVYSTRYRIAALGNIATHPEWRNQGLAKLVTARLCQSLLETVDLIGLNVKADNLAAISCYRKLGFEITNIYYEYMVSGMK